MPPVLRLAVVLALPTGSTVAQNAYETDFTFLAGSSTGVPLAGRDGFFVPATNPASHDGAIYTYSGNALQLPLLGQFGGSPNFLGLDGAPGPAQIERVSVIPVDCQVHIEFDFCVHYAGVGAPSGVIGGFSLQPAATATTMSLIARWPANASSPPATWNADLVVGPSQTGAVIQVPHPNFQNLAVDTWYRWGCSVHVAHGEYTLLVIDDLVGVRTLFTPPLGTLMINPFGAPPTAFRLSAIGPGVQLGFDRMSVAYHGIFDPFGAGCPGSLGVPQLRDLNGSRPVLGSTFQARLSNVPLDIGAIAWGVSKTLWGSLPLPADLGPVGMTNCSLFVDPAQIDALVGSAHAVTWTVAVPGFPFLMGLDFYSHGVTFDPPANPAGLVLSNAAHGCLGR